jgi:hypothetical protein
MQVWARAWALQYVRQLALHYQCMPMQCKEWCPLQGLGLAQDHSWRSLGEEPRLNSVCNSPRGLFWACLPLHPLEGALSAFSVL